MVLIPTLIEGFDLSPPIFPSFTIARWVSSHHCPGVIPELCYQGVALEWHFLPVIGR
jgi:hypothetical protein